MTDDGREKPQPCAQCGGDGARAADTRPPTGGELYIAKVMATDSRNGQTAGDAYRDFYLEQTSSAYRQRD